MRLADTTYDNSETGCCARLDPARWDDRKHAWVEKPFLRDRVHELFHIPLDFGPVIRRDLASLEEAAAFPPEPLWLVDEVSPWRGDVYVATDRPVPGATMEHMSGIFLSKVFTGPHRDLPRWSAEMASHARDQGASLEHIYFFYPYCPRCAGVFDGNPVVLFGKVR